MAGTLTFNSSGQLTASSAFTPKTTSTGDLTDLTNWTPAAFGTDGYPVFAANFSGSPNASTTDDTGAIDISLNFGMSTKTPSSRMVNHGYRCFCHRHRRLCPHHHGVAQIRKLAHHQPRSPSRHHHQPVTQDGYAVGTLQGVEVDKNGTVYGNYSNGRKRPCSWWGLQPVRAPQGAGA